MRLHDPYELWLPNAGQLSLLAVAIALTVWLAYLLMQQGVPIAKALPNGILDLEAPWSTAAAEDVLRRLGDSGRAAARAHTRLDFAFVLLYPLALSLACALIAGGVGGKTAALGVLVAWGVLLAAPLDALENVCMLRLLAGHTEAPWPQLATIFAAVKFTLVAGGLAFVLTGCAVWLAQWLKS